MTNKQKLCPECLERHASVELERYDIGPDCSIIGEEYQAESGWACTECDYYRPDFPIGCIVVVIVVLLVAALGITVG